MGFLSGAVSFLRFRAGGPAPRLFDQEHLDKLAAHAAGRQRIAAADGVEVGWTAGDHVLDTDFQLDKNIINDALCFELAVDTDRLPADKLKAYVAVELKALTKDNPSGFPSARQKREAKEIARERLEAEAKDGRYRKRKCTPVMWDRTTGEVLFGATSLTQVDRLCSLFDQTFGAKLECVTAGPHANRVYDSLCDVDFCKPSPFVPGTSTPEVAWIPLDPTMEDPAAKDFLGNEFLLWLWWFLDVESDTIALPDGTNAAVMIARGLSLECPLGQTGVDAFSHEGPARLPEARRAIQAGKLPRKCGLTVVRHDQQYEFTLHAETLAVGAGKLPPPPDDVTDARATLESRVDRVRELVVTLDLLFGAFLARRLGTEWAVDLAAMQRWLVRERAAA